MCTDQRKSFRVIVRVECSYITRGVQTGRVKARSPSLLREGGVSIYLSMYMTRDILVTSFI